MGYRLTEFDSTSLEIKTHLNKWLSVILAFLFGGALSWLLVVAISGTIGWLLYDAPTSLPRVLIFGALGIMGAALVFRGINRVFTFVGTGVLLQHGTVTVRLRSDLIAQQITIDKPTRFELQVAEDNLCVVCVNAHNQAVQVLPCETNNSESRTALEALINRFNQALSTNQTPSN